MLEINCNKCENLIDKNAGCKLYGSNPENAVNACANDQFKNYKPGDGDLISRSALIAEYDRVHVGEPGTARKLMEDAPAVDAVEVVRCEKCMYWNKAEKDMIGCCEAHENMYTTRMDYCSKATKDDRKYDPKWEREDAEDDCAACTITYSWEREGDGNADK